MDRSDDPHPRLTIGMFTDTYAPEANGVVTSVASTARALRRRGHRIIIVAPAHPEGDEEHPDVFHLRSTAFPFYPGLRMAFPLPAKLVAALPAVPFDVIHTHTFFFIGCLGAYLASLRKLPLFFTYHTRFEDYASYVPGITKTNAIWISREFSNRCDRVIAPSADTVALLQSYGVTTPFEILPGGVDLESFGSRSEVPEVVRKARPGSVLLFVGRLGKEKNLDRLLEAFARLLGRRPDAHLIIVGDGPYRAGLEQRAAALGCGGHTTFVGALEQDQLGAYYGSADAFVFTSLTETQGLVLVEAMAVGLPVVAVDCPVTREIVLGDAGVLTADDADAFAVAVDALLNELPERRLARQEAARRAVATFSIEALAQRLEELYLRALRDVAVASP